MSATAWWESRVVFVSTLICGRKAYSWRKPGCVEKNASDWRSITLTATGTGRQGLALANLVSQQNLGMTCIAFHMPRAMRSFETTGWKGLVAWPFDYRTSAFCDGIGWNLTRNLAVLNTAIRENVGKLAYWLSGR